MYNHDKLQGLNNFQKGISQHYLSKRTVKIPDTVPFYEFKKNYNENAFKYSRLVQSILDDSEKELKFGEFSNSKIPDGFKYFSRSLEGERDKRRILNNKVMVNNNFECYLEAYDYTHSQGQFVVILTQDNKTFYLTDISWLDIIRDMTRENGVYNIKDNRIEGNFRFCLFNGKDYRLLSDDSLAYHDIVNEIEDRMNN